MRELETSLQQFGEFILKARLVGEKAAPYCVRWVPPIPGAPSLGRVAGLVNNTINNTTQDREWAGPRRGRQPPPFGRVTMISATPHIQNS